MANGDTQKFGDLWYRLETGGLSAEASDLSANGYGETPPDECPIPGCPGIPLWTELTYGSSRYVSERELRGWTARCPRCKTHLTIWND